ncbi:capsular polysaccharide export protein, LipB/KpsS family [Sphingomonas prati]|uniref:Capsular polysaccharide export protein n=1 Tax=Sphingomonas prati TaxID=1843237 RepID=A0A7W9F201_9SPHN|nr:beta-3-deoxy-D-manno-oct-2-ulosonic acid transferase [Sphingomonas prati]MBB5729858.1 capsular polysaccharide export protein [Sphingomonas prati]GGE88965.1 capsular polysaccharide biosynthesis protein [Sphingomonas prati]
MLSSLPVLRAPPFPGIRPQVASVSAIRVDRRPESVTADRADTDALITAVRTARVGGTFWGPTPPVPDGPATVLRPRSGDDAQKLATEALDVGPAGQVVALLPKESWAPRAQRRLRKDGIASTIGDVDPWPLLRPDVRVIAHGDDELVLLAQIAGAQVSVRSPGRFAPASPRRAPTIADRVFADMVAATVYRDPMTGDATEAIDAVAMLADWRRAIDANRGIAVATGMARWKRREIERFLWSGSHRPLRFVRSAATAVRIAKRTGGVIATWPSRSPPGLTDAAAAAGVPVCMVEDGFIRSVGLGAACVPPLSVALDMHGIHYDPSRPSDLESLLAETEFDDAMLDRARALIDYVVDHGIGKYGAGRNDEAEERPSGARRRVLVTGQVEDDLSVRLGGGDVRGNFDLLARARAAELDADLWYRPHPDVDAGLRRGAVPDDQALLHADRVVRGGSMATLLDQVDGVHVLTSLAGFEALLRGRDVTVHGQPFFAGWGLTRDLAPPIVRRKRRLTIVELVAGVLILYPRYLDPQTGLPCRAERMTERLAHQNRPAGTLLTRVRGIQGRISRLWQKG